MTINDLASRMVVETRNGKRYIVVEDYLLRSGGCLNLKEFNYDLKHYEYKELDIIKVYNKVYSLTFEDENLSFLWSEKLEEMAKSV